MRARIEGSHRRRSLLIAAAVVSVAPAVMTSPATAAVRSWIAADGNWSTPGNWSTATVPLAGDEAVITIADSPFGRLVTYDYAGPALTLNAFRLGGGLVASSGNSFVQSANVLTTNLQQVGLSGRASYSLSGGTNTVGQGGLFVGVNAGARGAYFVSGTGALRGSHDVHIGVNGNGSFTQTGGSVTASRLSLADSAPSIGVYTLSAGALTSSSDVRVGIDGAATFNHSGGTHETQNMTVGAGTTSRGTYALSGTGSLSGGNELVGDAGIGTFIHTGGTNTAKSIGLGARTGGTGVYTLSGDGALIATGSFGGVHVGGAGAGTFVQTGGTHTLVASGNSAPGLFLGAQAGGAGTYLLSGGRLESNNGATVGGEGTGVFNQSGGIHRSGTITVGSGSLSSGTYLLSSGALDVTGGLTVGGFFAATGTFLQSGGTVNVGIPGQVIPTTAANVAIGGNGGTGHFGLSGGTINVHVGLTGIGSGTGGAGTFEQTGGIFNHQGLLVIGGDIFSGTGSGAGNGTYRLTGGRLNATSISIGNILTLDGVRLLRGGTFEGGGTDGVVSGRFTQDGGTVTGVLRNEGDFLYKSGTFAGEMVNRGTFTIEGTTFASPLTATNDDLGLITGSGTIAAAVDNRGTIAPNGALAATQLVTNRGIIRVAPGTSFVPAQVNNLGQINLTGGALLGGGSISNNAAAVIAGGGTIQTQLVQNGGVVRADNPGVPLVITSPVVTSDPASQFVVAPNAMMTLGAPLSNSAIIALQGQGASLTGAPISNSGTIRGAGQIANNVTNNGVIRPEGGALIFTGGVSNAGTVALAGAMFDNANNALANTGTIVGRGALRAGALNNGGTVTLSGGVSDVFAPVVNTNRINVTGSGVANFFDSVNTAGGTLNVNTNSTAVFFGPVTGVNRITGGGVKNFEAGAAGGAIATVVGTTLVGPQGNLTATSIRDAALDVIGRATIAPNGTAAATSRVNALEIDGAPGNWTGTLDLNDNDLILDYADASPLADLRSQLRSGFAGGAWNGSGITSTRAAQSTGPRAALGYADASSLNLTSFNGEAIDATSAVIKYTLAGDANLDERVNLADFNRLAANFGQPNRFWVHGDFNYDGGVNLADFNLLASNFGQIASGAQVTPQDWVNLAQAVPEPSCALSVGGVVASTAASRRRRGRMRR